MGPAEKRISLTNEAMTQWLFAATEKCFSAEEMLRRPPLKADKPRKRLHLFDKTS